MLVTDKKYSIDKSLVTKLDLMVKRMQGTDDNLVLIDGDEGQGKSNLAAAIGYYMAYTCKRPWSIKNIFFNLDDLIDFAIKTDEQIIIWDEGALGGLASEWWNKNQKKFLKLLMVARKKKHFWVICIPKFFKLNEYFVIDRSIALIHVYSRDNIQKGRFCYFNKSKKEKLYYDWKRKRMRSYKKWKGEWGTFSEALPIVLDEAEYDAMKTKAILDLGNEEAMTGWKRK